jgi:hypothetical protein
MNCVQEEATPLQPVQRSPVSSAEDLHLSTVVEKETRYIQYGPLLLLQ